MSMDSNSVVKLDLNWLSLSADQNPSWKKVVLRHRETFNTQHQLNGHVMVKNWGMAVSPLNDLMATCITLHPSQLPEYIIQADYRTTLSIHPLHARLAPAALVEKILRENLSAEIIAFSLKFWLKSTTKSSEERNSAIREILDEVDKVISQVQDLAVPNESVPYTPNLNALLFHSKWLKVNRLKLLLSLFDLSANAAATESLDWPIIAKLTTTVLRLPRKSWKGSIISKYILLEYQKAIPKLPVDLVHQAEELVLTADKDEQCEVCEARIPFENFTWARCAEGHQFGKTKFLAWKTFC
jgi:hypothetical protein